MVREVVEISLRDYENRKDEIAAQLHEAAKSIGFFYISGARTEVAAGGRLAQGSERLACKHAA